MILYPLGTILLVAGLAASLLASISYLLVTRGQAGVLAYGRGGTYAALASGLAVTVLLVYAFMARRYDVAYVNNYSSDVLEAPFRFAAIWAGQPGSFLVWTMIGLLFAPLLMQRARHFEPYVLAIVMLLQAALFFFMIVKNPFVPLTDANGLVLTPEDGRGLNPLLHNFWMVIHPPVLFTGYALLAMPFAFALAGLWRRDYDTWVQRAMPWALAGWALLGLALLLGGYWAYETLGWGGYWAWDPVENSALVPWLLVTALIHGMLLQRTHGAFRRVNFFLAILSYLTVIYATFLTRTGVLSNFSVHSFVEEGLTYYMTAFLAILAVLGIGMFLWRVRDIPGRAVSDKLLSRDSFFVLGILTVCVTAVVVWLGTSMPVVSSNPAIGSWLQTTIAQFFDVIPGENGQFGVSTSYFQRATPPLGLVALVLMTVGPLLGWRDTNPRNLLYALRWPALAAVIGTSAAVLLGVRAPLSVLYVGFGIFCVGTNLVMIIRTLRSGWLRLGGYLAHAGLAIFFIGVVGSYVYATPDEQITVPQGEPISIYGYTFDFNQYTLNQQGRGVLDLTVTRGNEQFAAQPQLWFNDRMGATVATPAIRSHIFEDVYISPVNYIPPSNLTAPVQGEQVTIGPYGITFVEYVVPDSTAMQSGNLDGLEFGARLDVTYQGQTTQVEPRVKVRNDAQGAQSFEYLEAALPGGDMVRLENIAVETRQVLLVLEGDNIPMVPARAVVTVSVKPAVALVWVGVIVLVLGGLVAMLRRGLEGQLQLAGLPRRLPRRLGGLVSALSRAR